MGGTGVIKVTVTFDLLVRGKIFLFHLKAYIYSFFESDANSFFAPFMVKKKKKKKGKKRKKKGLGKK